MWGKREGEWVLSVSWGQSFSLGRENFLEMDDDKGTSLVFVNSKKGQQLFESIKNDLNVKPQDMDIAIQHNISMVESVAEPSKRQAFMLAVQTMDWDVLEKKFFKNFIWNKVYNYAKKIIKLLLYKY